MTGLSDPNWCKRLWRERERINAEWNATVEQMEAEIVMLRRCLSEHHSVGVLDGVLAGDRCPVCAKWLDDSNWCKRREGGAA